MSELKTRRFFYGIRTKVILIETMVLAVLFFITFLTVNYFVKKERFEVLTETYTNLNDKLQTAFEKTQNEVDQLSGEFILNEYVQKSLTNQRFTASDKEMLEKSIVFLNKSYVDYYLVLDNKGNYYTHRNIDLDMERFYDSRIYKSLEDTYSQPRILWTKDEIFGTNEMSFFAVRYIREMNYNHEPGILILKLNDNLLAEVKASIENDCLAHFILDEKQQVCFGQLPGGKQWNPENEEGQRILYDEILISSVTWEKWGTNGSIICKYYNEDTGFSIITYAPRSVTHEVLRKIQQVMILVFLLMYGVAIVLTIFISRRVVRPIEQVSDIMSGFDEKHLDDRIHLDTNTELDQIGNAYNKMVVQVKNLMEDVKQKESELHASELQSLMYQIRPHFLYNTLDTIYMLARIQKEETIMRMIQSLSRFLRINLSNGNEEIDVSRELEHVGSYLEIQKIRNADLFAYEVEMQEEVSELPMMKMVLQPVAENCIKYGFRNIDEGGLIRISAFREEQYVVFIVENNGEIIEAEALEKLNRLEKVSMEEMNQVIQQKQGGYGIRNVVKRLRMRYDDNIRFYYEPIACQIGNGDQGDTMGMETGTKCVIKIPVEE